MQPIHSTSTFNNFFEQFTPKTLRIKYHNKFYWIKIIKKQVDGTQSLIFRVNRVIFSFLKETLSKKYILNEFSYLGKKALKLAGNASNSKVEEFLKPIVNAGFDIDRKERKQNSDSVTHPSKPLLKSPHNYLHDVLKGFKIKEGRLITADNEQTGIRLSTVEKVLNAALTVAPGDVVYKFKRSTFVIQIDSETEHVNKFCCGKINKINGQFFCYYIDNYIDYGSTSIILSGLFICEGGKKIVYKKAVGNNNETDASAIRALENEEIIKKQLIQLNHGRPPRGLDCEIIDVIKPGSSFQIGPKSITPFETDCHAQILNQYNGDLIKLLMRKPIKIGEKIQAYNISLAEKHVLAHQILDGLRFLILNNMVHYDLKTDNIFIRVPIKKGRYKDLQARIGDFGFARFKDDPRFNGGVQGTPDYIPYNDFLIEGNLYQDFRCLTNEAEKIELRADIVKKYVKLIENKGKAISDEELLSSKIELTKKIINEKRYNLCQQRDVFAAGQILYHLYTRNQILYQDKLVGSVKFPNIDKAYDSEHYSKLYQSGLYPELCEVIVEMLQPLNKKNRRISGLEVFKRFDEILKEKEPAIYQAMNLSS